ncbi:MAG: hypothetical protein SVR94_19870, partial [Pseudomonadota bacterium]|nr:hypothetical protein [Pseudomonadota bacterium]
MKILFLLPVSSHVRFRKRINALKFLGAKVKVLSFTRDYYEGSTWDIDVQSLGKIEHGYYMKRLVSLFKVIPKVRTESKSCDVIYTFGLDLLLLSWLAANFNNKKIVYELGDLGIRTEKSFKAKLINLLESKLLYLVDKLILTSLGYYEG